MAHVVYTALTRDSVAPTTDNSYTCSGRTSQMANGGEGDGTKPAYTQEEARLMVSSTTFYHVSYSICILLLFQDTYSQDWPCPSLA